MVGKRETIPPRRTVHVSADKTPPWGFDTLLWWAGSSEEGGIFPGAPADVGKCRRFHHEGDRASADVISIRSPGVNDELGEPGSSLFEAHSLHDIIQVSGFEN